MTCFKCKRIFVTAFSLFCAISLVAQNQKEIISYKVNILPNKINSQFSEFSPQLFSDSHFFYTQIKNEASTDYYPIFDDWWNMVIYTSKLSKTGFVKPQLFAKEINNDKFFINSFTFNKNRTSLYFSRCSKPKGDNYYCEICKSELKNGIWSKPMKLPSYINVAKTKTQQPFLVEYDEYDVLYFTSDRDEGFGNADIYYTIIKNDNYGEPVNLGSIINSSSDEVSPYYNTKTNTLFFSSNRKNGIGGFDVYKSAGNLSQWYKIEILPQPVNSKYNDIYYFENGFDNKGYFASNRPPSKNKIKDTCCYDIYSFEINSYVVKDSNETHEENYKEIIDSYIPLRLYFDNDMPDSKSLDPAITDYNTLYSKYIERKDIFIKENKKEIAADQKYEKQIVDFFDEEVVFGVTQLSELFDKIFLIVKSGFTVKMTISGYSSSLHSREYNMLLSMRRIVSVVNYAEIWNGGILKPFIETEKIEIIPLPLGSDEAIIKRVSADRKDTKKSVYSIEASQERRAEISNIEIIYSD